MVVKASGQALVKGSPRNPNTFLLDLDDEDEVTKLSCTMSGEGKAEIWSETLPEGKQVKVSYRVGLVGNYKISIEYDGQHIEGSPFVLKI